LPIDVLPELTEAMRLGSQASSRLLGAARSPDREQHRSAWQDCLAAQQRLREAWLAMATPFPTSREKNNQ
jgi:hypothetical protein